MKKMIGAIVIVAILTLSMFLVVAVNAAAEPVSPGPAPDYGDGVPDGNQFIQPDAPGLGPAPNAGDGDSDGPSDEPWP